MQPHFEPIVATLYKIHYTVSAQMAAQGLASVLGLTMLTSDKEHVRVLNYCRQRRTIFTAESVVITKKFVGVEL